MRLSRPPTLTVIAADCKFSDKLVWVSGTGPDLLRTDGTAGLLYSGQLYIMSI
jgi:hypothetical protein